MNKVILMGNLTRDPEVRYTQSSEPLAVANFSIAVNRRFRREGDTDVDFINCVCFGKQGETIGKYFTKGRRIAVVGRLQVRNWQDNNGNKRTNTDVVVEEFYFCDSKSDSANNSSASTGNFASAPAKSNNNFYQVDESVDEDDLPF